MLVALVLGIERINSIHIQEYEWLFLHSDSLNTFDAYSTSFFQERIFGFKEII